MSTEVYVEFQDLKVRVNTADSALAGYSNIKLCYIDPDGNSEKLVGHTEDTTWVAADMDKTKLQRGWWRFAAEANDIGGKLRKTKWYKKFIYGEGEVVQE